MLLSNRFHRIIYFFVLLLVFIPQVTSAGSISDNENDKYSQTCDRRVTLEKALTSQFCTEQMRDMILDQRYVVVHREVLSGHECSWQGCKSLSLVGQPAKLRGEFFIEYGMPTKREDAPYLKLDEGILPQFPFKRHYITARTALEARKKNCRRTGFLVRLR